jgi:hypothetical protein
VAKQDDSGELKQRELTDILLSQTDFEQFKELILESKKKDLLASGVTTDDSMFNIDNLQKMMVNESEWTIIN